MNERSAQAAPGSAQESDQVDFIRGGTRLFGIVGHPIEQVRSPEMVTAELHRRGRDAILVPLHVAPDDFDRCLPNIMKLRNLDGLVFTIPYKAAACALAQELGRQATIVGAINALGRAPGGGWRGEIFDGIGCVEALRRRGVTLGGRRIMLIGAGGAGSAIGVAIALERPDSMHLFDADGARAQTLAGKIRGVAPDTEITIGTPIAEDIDVLLNASPVGMLDDPRIPLEVDRLPQSLVVFDAVVKPERTPLLAFAQSFGCTTVTGREMMRGQIAKVVDFLIGG